MGTAAVTYYAFDGKGNNVAHPEWGYDPVSESTDAIGLRGWRHGSVLCLPVSRKLRCHDTTCRVAPAVVPVTVSTHGLDANGTGKAA